MEVTNLRSRKLPAPENHHVSLPNTYFPSPGCTTVLIFIYHILAFLVSLATHVEIPEHTIGQFCPLSSFVEAKSFCTFPFTLCFFDSTWVYSIHSCDVHP